MNHLACLQKKESRIKLLYAAGAMWTYFLRLRAEKCAAKSCSDTKVLADVCWLPTRYIKSNQILLLTAVLE